MDLVTIKNKIIEGAKLIFVQPTMYFINKIEDLTEDDYDIHVVSPFEKGRIDLIALKVYGDATKSDLILKFNNISDPFSIAEGESIKIPAATFPYKTLDRVTEVEENIVKQQFIDSKRLSKKDQNRVDALKAKYDKEALLPPNVIPVGKKAFKIKNGKITFGAQAQSDPVVDSILNKKSQQFSNRIIGKNSKR